MQALVALAAAWVRRRTQATTTTTVSKDFPFVINILFSLAADLFAFKFEL